MRLNVNKVFIDHLNPFYYVIYLLPRITWILV